MRAGPGISNIFGLALGFFVLCNVVLFQSRSCYPIIKIGVEIPDRFEAVPVLVARPLPKMLFFFFKKCFWHCSLSSQKMLKISRDSLKNAFSHFLSRLKIRSNKQMIKDQDTGMGGGGGMLSYFRKGEEDSAILHK